MTPSLQALTQRIEELEKQLAHLAALAVEHSDAGRIVEARGFVARDEQGKPRATLRVEQQGTFLTFAGADGKTLIEMSAEESGPGPDIRLFGADGRPRMSLQIIEGFPQVFLHDANGRPSLMLDRSGLVVYDGNAERRLIVELSPSGRPGLFMRDANGDSRVNLSVESEGPRLAMGKDNKVIWSAP